MAFSPSSPVTGGAQTGLTSPTYTIGADTAPEANSKQYAVSALGGTQTGVNVHSVSSPFTVTMWRPRAFKALGRPNPITGLVNQVPNNTFSVFTRKGVTPLAGQPIRHMMIRTIMDVPAGSDLADAPNVRAALSLHFGVLSQVSAGVGDTVLTGTL